MNDNGFKEFIENRGVAEIMEDYAEQHDEWESLVVVKDGKVVKFRHKNGKVFFCEQYTGELSPDYDECAKILKGKTIKEQMGHFRITESARLASTSYGDIDKVRAAQCSTKLCNYSELVKLLLKDDLLVGAVIKGDMGDSKLLLGSPVCTYCASDNEGSGYKERMDFAFLMFFPEEI